ncbi:MAG: hypothetical protein ILA15_09840 [Clostridiales bacterium]|nr:hypothetical protein [Clostridiales bacterium]
MANNYKERLLTYVNYLQKMIDRDYELRVIQRELYKFVQFGIDDYYSVEERKGIVEALISIANSDKVNKQQRALILANAYKLNQINGLGINVPLEHLEETLIIDEEPRPLSEVLLRIMKPRHIEQAKKMQEKQRPDEDLLRLFNISLGAFQFKQNPYYLMFRTYD